MELPCKSNLYPLLTVYSPVGSPLQARKSSCGKRASEIWRIRWASTSEKVPLINSVFQDLFVQSMRSATFNKSGLLTIFLISRCSSS
ncbi:hypothetical protein ES332_A07G119900v1 [Gossypium tomentosum]|uniref:Uncharacterized protein n=1 Tax=Gossypium tomentosum TaxID=34277 RepID=A0A5D2PU76_GOSTO|nr:hypothetical protein ES332_A07G119900v1 [Gossypium tomentosum]